MAAVVASTGTIACACSAPAQQLPSNEPHASIDLCVSPRGADALGSPESFNSIQEASRFAKPGATIHILPGIYEGGIMTTASGTASNPIRYVSDVKWGAKIVPSSNSTSEMAWDNRGAYVTIDGFDIDGMPYRGGAPWRIGLYTAGAYSIVTNNRVHNIAATAPCTGKGGAGIEGDSYYRGSNIDVIGNVVHDIGAAKCRFIHGIYQTAPGTVANNLVYRISGWGIHLWHDANHITIANNTVVNSAIGGLLVGGGDFINTSGPADYVIVANNIVFDNMIYGIIEAGRTGSHNLFTHNLSFRHWIDWRLITSAADHASVSADPRFLNYVRDGEGDYHLAAGSPAIDAGAPIHAPSSDLDGISRPHGAGYDIGAYEFAASSSSRPASVVSSNRDQQCR